MKQNKTKQNKTKQTQTHIKKQMIIPIIDRCYFFIFYEFSLGIVFWKSIGVGTYFYILDFCYFVMCLVCALPDVCIFLTVWQMDCILCRFGLGILLWMRLLLLVVRDLLDFLFWQVIYFFRWGEYGCCSVVELVLLLVLYG